MTNKFFSANIPNIPNDKLRIPQSKGFEKIQKHYSNPKSEKEVGIILPVGCGKTGLITLAPFAVRAKRALVVAPGLTIARQLLDNFDPSNADKYFYAKADVVEDGNYPEPVEIRGDKVNKSDLEEADVVITNAQQLQGGGNKWKSLPKDYFDLIIFDEGHHNKAKTWEDIKEQFPNAKIINLSATPLRADGQLMSGKVIYSFPIYKAIEEGYVKRLKAKVLSPKTLKYFKEDDGKEIEITSKEILSLGQKDSSFRRGIVTSNETLTTIVDASIRELERIRKESGDNRHKIIAAALNQKHCIKVVEAFASKGMRADYIHSEESDKHNAKILNKLEAHELDVIVQVRKLGEGFDHPYLSVAAVCSVFLNLSPFVQFVGRIMRVVEHNDATHPSNQGVVVFHQGSNIASRWSDFQQFSEADQKFFDELLPLEIEEFESGAGEIDIDPIQRMRSSNVTVISEQKEVSVSEIHLTQSQKYKKGSDNKAKEAVEYLESLGHEVILKPVPVTKQRKRLATKKALDETIKNEVGQMLAEKKLSHDGRNLDKTKMKSNFVFLKALTDKKVKVFVGQKKRSELSQGELDGISSNLKNIIQEIKKEVFSA